MFVNLIIHGSVNRTAYAFQKVDANLYKFTSEGVSRIEKVVEFLHMSEPGVMNLGFGDSVDGRMMDDEVVSNNGDVTKVMATIIRIVEDFTLGFPEIKVHFKGSTLERTKLYGRILRTYYTDFSRNFSITAMVKEKREEVPFDPGQPYIFDTYFIKRKNKFQTYGTRERSI